MANTVDPKQYQIYVERQGENYIDYEKITDNANKLLADEVDRRDKIKQDLEARANDLYDQLGKVEMNSDSRFSDQVLDAATQIRKSLMLDQSLLKKGQISVNEYKQQLERAKQQMAEWGVITKEFGKYKDDYNARLQIDEETGEPIMAPDEMIIKESSLGFSYTYDKQIYVDPITKNTYYYTPNKDGSIPDFNEEPDKFMAMSNARNRFQYSNDRKQYDIGFQVKKEKDMLGQIVDAYVSKFKGFDRVGTYVMTETDYIVLEKDGLLDEFVDTIYAKTSGTDRGLANSADVMGEFTIAMSLEQFKKNCKGGDLCDEKYFIKVNPNDPSGMTYEFMGGKEFVEERVKADIKEKANMQLGRKEEISGKSYDPNESAVGAAITEEEERQIGFLGRVQDIAVGNLNDFSSGSAQGIQDINQEIRDAGGSQDNMIDSIKRQGDSIIVEYQNGRKEIIDRKDSNGNFKDTEGLMSELYQLVVPSKSRSDKSFDDLLKLYTDSGKTISKSTRGMTDNEIKKELEVNKAIENLKKGNTDPDYEPTPDEIKKELTNVKVSKEEIDKAKAEGRITYVGEDAVGFSSRDPYKLKSSGDAIIRGEGDQLPTMTGEESLRQALSPNDPSAKKLPVKWFGNEKIDGAMEKVLDAYLPRKLRAGAEISVDADNKLVVTYNGVDLDIPGVTDLKVTNPAIFGIGGSTYEELNKALNKAANVIINKENEILRTRGGGGALPSAY